MVDIPSREQQLALVLQASRDWAFVQMSRGERLIPFATRAKLEGEIEFTRFAEEDSTSPLDAIYAETQEQTAREAARGELSAAALVAAVKLDEPLGGHDMALRVHIEAIGFCRQVLVPYTIEEPAEDGGKATLSQGEMVAVEAEKVLFTL